MLGLWSQTLESGVRLWSRESDFGVRSRSYEVRVLGGVGIKSLFRGVRVESISDAYPESPLWR